MTVTTKTQRQTRRSRLTASLAASLIVGSLGTSVGCSGSGGKVASLNPFAGKPASTANDDSSSWLNGPKNAAAKSRDTLAGWFGGKKEPAPDVVEGDATDPTSLAHKAEVTAEVFVANGRLWESTGNFEKAMESYAKALEKDPNDPAALAYIARLHFRQENHQQAAEYFGKAIKQSPEDAGLYNDLGLTLSKLGNQGAAASTIEQALRLAPGSSRFANNLASVKFEAGEPEGALEVLVQNNQPAVAHFNMAYLHYKHGQAAEATRHLNQAIAYQPQADNDPAVRRAVDRSRELLAQIENRTGFAPGTAIAATPNNPSTAPAGRTSAEAANTAGSVRPASTDSTGVRFGNASFKAAADTADSKASTPSDSQMATPAGISSEPASSGEFSLPPGFQMP